jgi:hypothetical protein
MSNSTIRWALNLSAHPINPGLFDYRRLINFKKVTQLITGDKISGTINNLTIKLERPFQAYHSLNFDIKHKTIKINTSYDNSVINSPTTANSSQVLRRRILVYPSGTGA